MWQIKQIFVPSLTMQSTAPSHSGTRAWNKLKAQEDSLGQYAYDPQAVAAPMLVRSINTAPDGMVVESIFAFVSNFASIANLDLTHFYALQGTGEANVLRPVQALCSRKSLVTSEGGVVKYKATYLGASTASRLGTGWQSTCPTPHAEGHRR